MGRGSGCRNDRHITIFSLEDCLHQCRWEREWRSGLRRRINGSFMNAIVSLFSGRNESKWDERFRY
ncbi:hypothetical protein ACS0TY_017811 [Phlomoides rotata]